MRLILQQAWVLALVWSGAIRRARRELENRGAIIVLMFHRVLNRASSAATHSLPGIVVREDTFASLAAYVRARYQIADLREARPTAGPGPLRFAFSFDDGWSDNYSTALPIARRLEIPFTVFICSGLMGSGAPFWQERMACLLAARGREPGDPFIENEIERYKHVSDQEREQYLQELSADASVRPFAGDSTMSWDQALEMARAGVSFGSHTDTHQLLNAIPQALIRQEVRDSKREVEQRLGTGCDLFAYPNGDWTPEAREILAEENYRLAFTVARGAWTRESDPLAIPRMNVYESKLAGLGGRFSARMFDYTMIWQAWQAMRQVPAGARERTRNTSGAGVLEENR